MTILQAMRAPVGAVCAWAITGAAWAQQTTTGETDTARALREAAAREAALREDLVRLSDQQLQILAGLGALTALMVVVASVLLYRLRADALVIAKSSTEAAKRYYELPFGVPEGTVRGLVSMLVIVLGLAFLIVQGPLGIGSSEAVAGFISAVIAFYFVTREQAQTNATLRDTTNTMREATEQVVKVDRNMAVFAKAAFGRDISDLLETDSGKRTLDSVSRTAIGERVYVVLRDEVEKSFASYKSDRVWDQPPYRYNKEGLRALVLRCEIKLKESTELKPVADLFSLSADAIVNATLSKTGADLETAILNDICTDLEKAGVGVLP